ncbi:Phosphoserine phosphatase, partial [hydrothermal vent metagenome]
MTSYVITVIGDAEARPLEHNHVERLRQHLDAGGQDVWLAENEACDVFFGSQLCASELTKKARSALSGTRIDAVCMPVAGRQKKILISDMDSTVIDQECIDEMGDAYGVGQQIKDITSAAVGGQMGFSETLRQRTALMKGLEQALLENVYAERISLKPGARTLVQTMRRHGAYCILVSGGFSFFVRRIAERLGFHDHEANELIFKDRKLTGQVREPILGRTAKLQTLHRLCEQNNLRARDVLAVGDGANDIKMIEAAGLGVAFHGAQALRQTANACIDYGNLETLLYVQGFRKSQFVT